MTQFTLRHALLVLVWFAATGSVAVAQNPQRATLTTELHTSALQPGQDAVLAVVLDIKPGFHAQSHAPLEKNLIPLTVTLDKHPALEFGEPAYPEGHIAEYPALGRMSVYDDRVIVHVPLRVLPDAPVGPTTVSGAIRYQICDDKVCFMPERPKFAVETKIVPADEPVTPNQPELFADYKPAASTAPTAPSATTGPAAPASAPSPGASATTAPVTAIAAPVEATSLPGLEGSDWSAPFAFGAAFLAGLLFNVMPCVLPVLPLKAIGFYEASHHHRSRSFVFGLVFSLGLTAVFAALAVLVLVLRAISWGDLFSEPWFVWSIVVLLVGMAFSLFGVFTFNLPGGTYGFMPRHDTFGGNFAWGGLTAILATPCTAPLLPPLLLWATAQPAWVGVPAIVVVGVGMAFPYLILSAFPELARRFPRTGPWAELFKQMMGFMLLVAAAYFAGGRLVHGTGFWWLVLAVVAAACLYLVARTVQLSKHAGPLAVSTVLAVVLFGGSLWWTARVTGIVNRPTVIAANGAAAGFQPYSDALFDATRAAGKPVLVKFTANWCATCQVIEGTVFQDPAVWAALGKADIVPLKVDLTDSDAPGKELLLKLNPAGGIPLTAIFTPDRPQPLVLSSVYTSETLLAALAQLAPNTAVATK